MKEREFEGEDLYGNKVNYKVVATFSLNGRKYVFYTDMKNMFTGYYETKKIKNITNIEEYNMLMSVYNQLKVNNFNHEFFDYGYTFFEGKNYKIIYDKLERKRYFFELVEDRYREVQGKIKELLDDKFNVEILVLSNGMEDENKFRDDSKDNRKRIVKVFLNGVCISVMMLSMVPIFGLALTPNNLKETEIQAFETIENKEEIINALKTNQNLTTEQKAFFMSLDEVYNENLKYFDKYNVVSNLTGLNIVNTEKDNGSVAGQYNVLTNEITLMNANENDIENFEVLLHEYFHALSKGGLAFKYTDGVALSEGITEVLTVEYGSALKHEKIQGTYSKQQVYVRMLSEMIEPSIIKEAYFQNNVEVLIDELSKGITEEKAYQLIALINDELIYEKELGHEAYINEVNDRNRDYKITQTKIDSLFAEIFEAKKGYKLNDDVLICSYLDQIRKGNRAEYDYYKEGNTFYTEVNKYYFNDKIKSDIAVVEYYFAPGIAVKANKDDFKLLPNGKYQYVTDTNEELIFDQIQAYVLRTKMQNYIMENNRIKKTSKTR